MAVIAVYKSIETAVSPSKAPNIHCDRYEKGVRTLLPYSLIRILYNVNTHLQRFAKQIFHLIQIRQSLL